MTWLNSLLDPLRALWGRLRRLVHRLTERVAAHLTSAWHRHGDRLDADSTYRRTLVTAVTALATTLIPHPALAAALGVWITETPSPRLRPTFAEDDDEDEDEDERTSPAWRSTLWDSPFGRR